MQAGHLDKRVTLQSPSGARDTVGERVTVWADAATVWAQVEPLSAQRILALSQEGMTVSWEVRVRRSALADTVTHAWRVLYGARVLTVSAVQPAYKDDTILVLLCSEGSKQE